MRKARVLGIALLVISGVVLGGTVFRQPVADAASLLNVFVTNDSSHPVPVREQNTDASGNIKVHEQGTANVNVTNSSLPVSAPAVTGGGGAAPLVGNETHTFSETQIATALSIHLTSGIREVDFTYQGNTVAMFFGPTDSGNDSIVLDLARPIEFDTIACVAVPGSTTDACSVTWVGAQP